MPEYLKLSQTGSSPLPPPFRGLHSPGVTEKTLSNSYLRLLFPEIVYCFWLVECCFTSTETVGLLGTGAEDVLLDFHTAPDLCCFCLLCGLFSVVGRQASRWQFWLAAVSKTERGPERSCKIQHTRELISAPTKDVTDTNTRYISLWWSLCTLYLTRMPAIARWELP